ncbi:hypothetical protein HPB47_016614, partial [Ixodes persulcatus]
PRARGTLFSVPVCADCARVTMTQSNCFGCARYTRGPDPALWPPSSRILSPPRCPPGLARTPPPPRRLPSSTGHRCTGTSRTLQLHLFAP